MDFNIRWDICQLFQLLVDNVLLADELTTEVEVEIVLNLLQPLGL